MNTTHNTAQTGPVGASATIEQIFDAKTAIRELYGIEHVGTLLDHLAGHRSAFACLQVLLVRINKDATSKTPSEQDWVDMAAINASAISLCDRGNKLALQVYEAAMASERQHPDMTALMADVVAVADDHISAMLDILQLAGEAFLHLGEQLCAVHEAIEARQALRLVSLVNVGELFADCLIESLDDIHTRMTQAMQQAGLITEAEATA